jgi:hypothetical protein
MLIRHPGDRMNAPWIAFAFLPIAACAPVGTHYGSWSEGPVAAFTATSNDDCQRLETQRSTVNLLNQKIGQPSGPATQVTAAVGLTTIPNGAIDGPTLTCRGALQTATGTIGPGVLELRLADTSTPQSITVRDALWETDTDRDRRVAGMRKEQEKRIAEAPAREARVTAERRASAQNEPNKTVHCGVNRSQFWTTNAVCFALIEEVKYLSGKIQTESRANLVDTCARDVAQKLPGKDQPAYLNACENLIDAYLN